MAKNILSKILPSDRPYKLGLVLSGGGARGFAHLGALQALEEYAIKPDIISGVSAGAIVGAFYCDGYKPKEIFELFKKKGILRYSEFQIPRSGLLSLSGLQKVLEEKLSKKNIEDLPIPLIVGISNFSLGKMEYKDAGSISQVVLASSSIPILFSPVTIGKYQYVDGGLYDNLPAKPLRKQCEKIIGINVNPIKEAYKFKNLIQVAIRTFHLVVDGTVQKSRKMLDVLIEPLALAEFEILDSSKASEMYDLGYEEARKQLEAIQ